MKKAPGGYGTLSSLSSFRLTSRHRLNMFKSDVKPKQTNKSNKWITCTSKLTSTSKPFLFEAIPFLDSWT